MASDSSDTAATIWDSPWLRRGSRIVLLCYLTALIIGTHLPHPEEWISMPSHDKWLHFGAYFGLAFLMATRLRTQRPVTMRATLVIWIVNGLTGMADELTQMLPGINRHCEFADWLADIAGAACGLLIWHLLQRLVAKEATPVTIVNASRSRPDRVSD